eukprot:16802-Hanusia_phi.AAC.1
MWRAWDDSDSRQISSLLPPRPSHSEDGSRWRPAQAAGPAGPNCDFKSPRRYWHPGRSDSLSARSDN